MFRPRWRFTVVVAWTFRMSKSLWFKATPPVGIEPTTSRLTAVRSTDWAMKEYKTQESLKIPRFHKPAPPPNLPRPNRAFVRDRHLTLYIIHNVSQSTKMVWSSSSRNRTYNLTVNSRALYRLSYEGIKEYRKQDSNLRSHWLLQLECNPLDHSGIPAQSRFFCFYHIRFFFSGVVWTRFRGLCCTRNGVRTHAVID